MLHARYLYVMVSNHRLRLTTFWKDSSQALGYVKTLCIKGQLEKALQTLDQLETIEQHDTSAYLGTCICILQGCIRMKALEEAKHVHAHLMKCSLGPNDFHIWNMVIDMFAKCGSIEDAQEVFDGLIVKNVFLWTTMIGAYVDNEHGKEALELFKEMKQEGFEPDKVTYVKVLSACADISGLELGKWMHSMTLRAQCGSNVFVQNTLIDMYSKCGTIEDARCIFDGLVKQDVVSWNAMIAGYAQHGNGKEAITLFRKMQQKGLRPNKLTFFSILGGCSSISALEHGKQVHAYVLTNHCDLDIFVGSSLVDMYHKCGSLPCAQQVFDRLYSRDAVSWSIIIAGYAQQGSGRNVIKLLQEIQLENVKPNKVTFVSILNACAGMGPIETGKFIHASILRVKCELDTFVGNTLLDMYAKCGDLEAAWIIFKTLVIHNVVSWNTLLGGHVINGSSNEALRLFRLMRLTEIEPDEVTFGSIVSATAALTAFDMGKMVHAVVLRVGCGDIFISNTLIDMYIKSRSIDDARRVFDGLPLRDVVSWSSLISGYAQSGNSIEALKLFDQMELTDMNKVTFVSILSACAAVAALQLGKRVHRIILETDCVIDAILGNSLIDMYAKCGSLEDALQVFDILPDRNAISWSSMVAGYARHGDANNALKFLERMHKEGGVPTQVTFTSALAACSHACLLDEGCYYLSIITREHNMTPIAEHYACIIDLLGRAGYFKESEDLIDAMPFKPKVDTWTCLLDACNVPGRMRTDVIVW